MVDRSIPIILALVGTPVVFPHRGHLERRDRIQGEIPESNALAVLSRRGRPHESECDRSEQHGAHFCLPQFDASTAWRQREGPHSRKRRSVFCALSKFLAASSPIGSISLVEARSAPLKSAPLTVTRTSVAPPKAAPRSEALVRSAFLSDANSRSTRDRSASRRIACSRLLDFSTARMSPMDWFFMSALRLAPVSKVPTSLAPVKSAVMRAPDRSAPSSVARCICAAKMLALVRLARLRSASTSQA